MKITQEDICSAFSRLLTEESTPEEVAQWAANLLAADDMKQLTIECDTPKGTLWKALVYLSGVDLKESPDSYLHALGDFSTYFEEMKSALSHDLKIP